MTRRCQSSVQFGEAPEPVAPAFHAIHITTANVTDRAGALACLTGVASACRTHTGSPLGPVGTMEVENKLHTFVVMRVERSAEELRRKTQLPARFRFRKPYWREIPNWRCLDNVNMRAKEGGVESDHEQVERRGYRRPQADGVRTFLAARPAGRRHVGRYRCKACEHREWRVGGRRRGQALVRHPFEHVAGQHRPRPRRGGRSRLRADEEHQLFTWRHGKPRDCQAVGQGGVAGPRQGLARLLRQRRLRGRRDRAQDGEELPQEQR